MKWEDDLYAWVDEGGPRNAPSFNVERTKRLVFAVLISHGSRALPIALLGLAIVGFTTKNRHLAEQQALQQRWQETEKAAHEGKTGEAFRRLFGVPPPDLSTPFMLPEPLED